jgi:hypothetical protein
MGAFSFAAIPSDKIPPCQAFARLGKLLAFASDRGQRGHQFVKDQQSR